MDEAITRLVAERAKLSPAIQTARMNAGGTRVELGRERVILDTYRAALGPNGPALADAVLQVCRGRSASRSEHAAVGGPPVSWWRLDSCSLRSTFDAWVSTVLIEMNSSPAISL